MMSDVRVRFAPSPTGYLHIGGARTALFNWLFARKMDGRLVLRIEDTDTERLKEDSLRGILSSLNWLGLDYDEGPGKGGNYAPYFQSERTQLHQRYAQELLAAGKAYQCFCTQEELAAQREKQRAERKPFRYAGCCSNLSCEQVQAKLEAGLKPVLRIRLPEDGTVVVSDLIHGEVNFALSEFDDFIIMKSNGMPTYNFACVVDDHEMKISHVLRAEEHLSNTPKQVLLYQAFGFAPPQFGHLPMILAPDRSKLSKRHGATSVEEFRDDGYLPEAITNYLTLLGWAPGNEEEFFTLEQTVENFSLDKVSKKAAVYDVKKLAWMNGQYMSSLALEKLLRPATEFLINEGLIDEIYAENNKPYLEKLIDIVRVRVKTLKELSEAARPFFKELDGYDEKGKNKYFTPEGKKYLEACSEAIVNSAFDEQSLENIYNELAVQLEVKLAALIHPSRLALTGKTVSPGLFDVMRLLGKEKTVERLKMAATKIT